MAWNINGYNVFETAIELAIIWIIIFLAFRFLQGTRGGGVIRGLFILLLPLLVAPNASIPIGRV